MMEFGGTDISDTIVAPATAPFPSAIGAVRLSGRKTSDILRKIFSPASKKAPHPINSPRKAVYGVLHDEKGEELDDCIAIFYSSPKSYTGEDMAEIFVHGNPVLVEYVVKLCIKMGARHAREGEFTKRAYLNGKITLEKTEAINAIVRASTIEGVKRSVKVLQGEFEKTLNKMKKEIIQVLSEVEASIDFPEDVDEELPHEKILGDIVKLSREIEEIGERWSRTKFLIEGATCSIIGKPNVGKSTLFNAILGESRAIVSPVPGTTRDYIDVKIDIGGVVIRLVDTAGIRKTPDPIEEEGIKKAIEITEKSDIVICVFDSSQVEITEDDISVVDVAVRSGAEKIIFVVNKSDIGKPKRYIEMIKENMLPSSLFQKTVIVSVSAKRKEGIELLKSEIKKFILEGEGDSGLSVISSRQKVVLDGIISDIKRAEEYIMNLEYIGVSYSLRSALQKIDDIFGIGSSEEVINSIFQNFCIGK